MVRNLLPYMYSLLIYKLIKPLIPWFTIPWSDRLIDYGFPFIMNYLKSLLKKQINKQIDSLISFSVACECMLEPLMQLIQGLVYQITCDSS